MEYGGAKRYCDIEVCGEVEAYCDVEISDETILFTYGFDVKSKPFARRTKDLPDVLVWYKGSKNPDGYYLDPNAIHFTYSLPTGIIVPNPRPIHQHANIIANREFMIQTGCESMKCWNKRILHANGDWRRAIADHEGKCFDDSEPS